MFRLFTTLLLATLSFCARAQSLSGTITDAESGETLFGANVYLPAQGLGVTTNAYGFYALRLADSPARPTLIVSMLGYRSDTIIWARSAGAMDVALSPLASDLGTVEVTANSQEEIRRNAPGLVRLSLAQVREMPVLLGEKDALKALQLQAGVSNPREGFGGLFVRGGSPDQNLILLDGAPVYNAFHLFGFLSVFNTDALSSVDLYKGGFPARYGGRLASVIDVRMKEGNRNKFSGSGGIGLMTSRLTLEGPLGKTGKGSVLISGRRTYLDLLLGLLTGDGEKRILNFHDASIKANYELSDKDRIYLSAYTGRDNYGSEFRVNNEPVTRDAFNWGNRTLTARYNRQLGGRAFLNLTAIGSDFDFTVTNQEVVRDSLYALTYSSRITNLGLQGDLDWYLSPQHSLRLGGGLLRHNFELGTFARRADAEDGQESGQQLSANEWSLYLEDEFTPNARLRVNFGLRATAFQPDTGQVFTSIEPRLTLGYDLSNETTLKAAAGFARQYLHLLSNSGPGLPTSLWVPAIAVAPPQSGWQYGLGVAHEPKDKNWSVAGEIYYRTFDNLIGYDNGATFLLLDVLDSPSGIERFDILDNITTGDGRAYGLELSTRYRTKKLTANFAYTLARVDHRLRGVNDFAYFPANQDRRHDLNLNGSWRFHPRLTLGFAWAYGSGVPTTLPVGLFTSPGLPGNVNANREVRIYESRNGYRMPAVHRLDLSLRWRRSPRWGEAHWEIGVYNAYARANPFFLRVENQGTRKTVFQTTLLPLVPSLSYSFKF